MPLIEELSGAWLAACSTDDISSGKAKVARLDDEVYTQVDHGDVKRYIKLHAEFRKGSKKKSVTGYMRKEEFDALNVSSVPIPQNFAGLEDVMIPTRLEDQLFEIVNVVEDEDCVTITARHIWYRLLQNNTLWKPDKDTDYTAAAVCRNVMTNAVFDPQSSVASDCTDTKKGSELDYERKNLVECFLDPEKGICKQFGLSLIRNNMTFYCLKNVGFDRGFLVQNGKNLLGVERTESIENLVTRIAPFAKDSSGNIVWLDNNGVKYVDSQYIDDYSKPRLEIYDTGLVVGKGDVTAQNVQTKLVEAAQKHFSDDKVDLPEVTMKIDFLSIGDTEEYAQYRDLDKVYLYDIITIRDTVRGYDYSAQVIGIEHDILTGMMLSVTIGSITNADGKRKIATWQVPEVDGTNIRLKSLFAGLLADGSVTAEALMTGSVNTVHLASATIENLTTEALDAAKAKIHDLIAGSITADDIVVGSINGDRISTRSLTADRIGFGVITGEEIHSNAITSEKIDSNQIEARHIKTGAINADKIEANAITAEKLSTTGLEAINAKLGTADIAKAEIGKADIDYAKIKDLNAESAYFEQAVFQEAVGKKLYIPRLSVGYAQMVGATIGDLVIQASNGKYYGLDVDQSGNVTATERTVTQGEIASGHTTDGRTLVLGTDILATDLNTENIYASHALMDEITASSINVDKLLAREAVISWLNVQDLSSNDYIKSTIGSWASGSTITQTISSLDSRISSLGYGTVYMQPEEPSHADLVSGDIWIQTISEGTWQEVYDGYDTWTEIYNEVSTWQTIGSIPKMFVWDGRRWQEMYDAMLPTTLETEIEQLAYQVSIRATKDELDVVTGEVTEFRAELTVQAEEIRSAVSAVNAKAASFIMLADPRTLYDVSLGDIWIRSDENTTDWTAIKDTYASWTEVKDTYDDWLHLLGATTYVWNGSEWVETSDRADEIYLNTLIDQTSKSITLLAEAQAEFQDELIRQSARITVTASEIRSEVETVRGTLNRKTSIIQDDGQIALSALTFDHLGASSSGIYITPTDIRVLSGGKITVAASALYVGTNNKTLDQLLAEKGDITKVEQEFYISTKQDVAYGGSWSKNTPVWSEGKYIWTRIVYYHANSDPSYEPSTGGVCIQGAKGEKGSQGDRGVQGATGKGIKSVEVRFKLGDSYLNSPGGAWGTWNPEVPAYVNGKYYWSWTQTTYTDNSKTDLIVSEKGMNAEYDLVKSAQKTADDIINGTQKAYYCQAIQNTGVTIDDTNLEINSQGNLYINSGGAIVVRAAASTEQTPINAIVINQTGIAVASQGAISVASGGAFTINSGGKFKITSTNFSIDDNGAVTIKGVLTAYANSVIGGWTLGASDFHSGSGASYVALSTSGDYAFWAGSGTASSAPFRVKRDGTVTLTSLMAWDDEKKKETSVNLRTAGLWKLTYHTIRSYDDTSITLSNNEKINFNPARLITLSGEWTNGWTRYTVIAKDRSGTEVKRISSGTVAADMTNDQIKAAIESASTHKAVLNIEADGETIVARTIDASGVYTQGRNAGYASGQADWKPTGIYVDTDAPEIWVENANGDELLTDTTKAKQLVAAGVAQYYNSSRWAKATAANNWLAKIPNATDTEAVDWDCGAGDAYTAGGNAAWSSAVAGSSSGRSDNVITSVIPRTGRQFATLTYTVTADARITGTNQLTCFALVNDMGVNNKRFALQVNGLTAYSHAGETVYQYVEGRQVSFVIPSDCKTGTPTVGLAT